MPNTMIKREIVIANNSEEAKIIQISKDNLSMNELGQPIFSDSQLNKFDCRDWIRLSDTEIKIDAFSREIIKVVLTIPSTINESHFASLLFSEMRGIDGTKKNFDVRNVLACLILVQPKLHKSPKIEIGNPGFINGKLICFVNNISDYYVRIRGLITIFYKEGKSQRITFASNRRSVFPQVKRKYIISDINESDKKSITGINIKLEYFLDDKEKYSIQKMFRSEELW